MAELHTVWLWLSDEENWERFSRDDTTLIEEARALDHKGVVLERNSTIYFLDLMRLTQTNACTGRRRPIYEVKAGASWLVQAANGEWKRCSDDDTSELEYAFFCGHDCAILHHTQYADFAKWTLTDLTTGMKRQLRASPFATSESLVASPSSTGSNFNGEEQPRKRHNDIDESEGTETMTSDDFGSSSSLEETISVARGPIRRSSLQRKPGSWRWHNDSGAWSFFDVEIQATIEKSWASGAPEMMFTQGNDVYFLDLCKLTQTNVNTGSTRAIQRLEIPLLD